MARSNAAPVTRRSFSRLENPLEVPHLIDIQRRSFEELTDPRGIRFWPEDKGRDGCRTPMPWEHGEAPNGFTTGTPWLPVKPSHSLLSVADQNADPASTLAFYRRILQWRKAHPVLATGEIAFIDADEPILAYQRSNGDTAMLCVFNLSAEAHELTAIGLDGAELDSISTGATLSANTLALQPNGYAFISLQVGTNVAVQK